MKIGILVSTIGLACVGAVRADDAKAALAEAAQPMEQGVPEAAVAPLQKLADTLTGEDARAAKLKLIEALIASHRPESAWRVLTQIGGNNDGDMSFWRGQALAGMGKYQEALAAYRAAAKAGTHQIAAAFGVAEMLRALGQPDDARRAYEMLANDPQFGIEARLRQAELLLDQGNGEGARQILQGIQTTRNAEMQEKRLLNGRLQLLRRRADKASAVLEKLPKPSERAPRRTVIASLFAIADAHLELGTPDTGDDFLEDFINRNGTDPELPQIFAKLDQLYLAEQKPSQAELERWARDTIQPRRSLAQWYLAKWDLRRKRRDLAERHFNLIREAKPIPAGAVPGLLEWARLQIAAGKTADALAILDEAKAAQPDQEIRDEVDFEIARALYASQRFAAASAQFERLAATPFGTAAMYNASVGWLRVGDSKRAEADAQELAQQGDKSAPEDLALEKALLTAKQKPKDAVGELREFVRQYPASPRLGEAYLALAELTYHAASPRLEEAERNLAAARTAKPSAAVVEGADYLAIWLADARGTNGDRVIALANDFLRAYPDSVRADEVRMKLAETYFRRQDFANAQTQFELIAQRGPKAPLTEKALFFAAQSAAGGMTPTSLDHALSLLADVAKMEGEFRWQARLQQAVIERQLGKMPEALLLYEDVLKGDASPAEKREALCGKGDIFLEQSATDASKLPLAIAAYDQLVAASAKQPHWRNQGLFKKGIALEKEPDRDAALATFYQVLEPQTAAMNTPEYFWYYKAGFNAARLLEEQKHWESAATVYQKLVDANGPRSDEAKARLDQLRLEHFLWD